jgi:hypothetical protein
MINCNKNRRENRIFQIKTSIKKLEYHI